MKKILKLIAILLITLNSKAQTRPNIVVFLVDDMGWQDCSVPFWDKTTAFNKLYHTPNMERLAKEGMKFTNAYAAPVCTPSRAALMSGMSPAHLKITNWTSPSKNTSSDANDDQFSLANWNQNGLSPVPGIEKTAYVAPLPKLLKDAGYFTVHVGKAHWGAAGTPAASPYNMGFIVNIAGHAAGHPRSYLAKENFGNYPQKSSAQAVPDLEEYYGSDVFLTEALTREAIKALETPIKNKQPFFLNLAHYAVHTPIMGDARYLKKYLDLGMDSIEARYATLVEGMDKSLGDIMDYLKSNGLDQNTVIMFMSDNGGLSQRSERGGGASNIHNLPLKAGKGSVYEGGIREPMIVKYPPIVKAGTIANQYVIIEDFFPTILELANIRTPSVVQKTDGQSFVPILKSPDFKDDNRHLVWHYPNKWRNTQEVGINYFSAIRKGDWKAVYNMRNGNVELYNLKKDIAESNNVLSQYPAKAEELVNLLRKSLKNWDASMPISKKTGKPIDYPIFNPKF